MQFVQDSFSLFVQGCFILEEFVWALPTIIIYILSIIDQLQNLAYIEMKNLENLSSDTFEISFFRYLSRPDFLFKSNPILSYISIINVNIFFLSCITFGILLKRKTNDRVTQITELYFSSIKIRILLIYINISINFLKYGIGYLIIEICFKQLQNNFQNILLFILYVLTIIQLLIFIPLFIKMFEYNWACNFSKEYLIINETNFSFYKVLIRLVQLSLSLMDNQLLFLTYIQIMIPIISSVMSIYFMIRKKIFIYGIYSQIILLVNICQIFIACQCLLKLIFPAFNFQSLWLILSILPFCYFKYYMINSIKIDFLSFTEAPIENNNNVLFLIKYNQIRNLPNFNQIVFMILLQKHFAQCDKIKCICKNYENQGKEALFLQIYENDLVKHYSNQLNSLSFKCSKEQIIFSYMQLLFFQKQYLKIFKYFYLIFSSQQNNEKTSLNPFLISQKPSQRNVFLIQDFLKIAILKVAQQLMIIDIQKSFNNQRTVQEIHALNNHQFMKDYLWSQNQKNKLQRTILDIIKSKVQYFDMSLKQANKKLLLKQSFDLIEKLINGQKQIVLQASYLSIQRKQNVEVFYKMEILNDMISSFNQSKLQQNNEREEEYQTSFDSDYSYMIAQINDQEKISIITKKILIPEVQDLQNFSDFIPSFIESKHYKLIEGFISGKENKFYQKFNESFIQISVGLIQKIDLIMDLNKINEFSIEMSIFFKKKRDSQYHLILDDKNRITSFDQNLFCEIFGWNKQYVNALVGLSIEFIFPNFFCFETKQYSEFIKQDAFFLDFQRIQFPLTKDQITLLWNDKYLNTFHLEIKIDNHFLNTGYQILTLRNIKQIVLNQGSNQTYQTINFFKHQEGSLIQESVIIDTPLELENGNFEDQINTQQGQSKRGQYDVVQSGEINKNFVVQQLQQSRQYFFDDEQLQSLVEESKADEKYPVELKKQKEKVTSQQSAVSQLEKSEYDKQFSLVYELLNSKKKPQTLIKLIGLIFLITATSIFGFSMYLYEIDQFHTYKLDFELLKIKDDIFYPLISFQIIRFALVNYNFELAYHIITQEKYEELIQFPQSQLIGSYEILKEGILDIFNQQRFFKLFEDKQLDLHFYLGSNQQGEKKSLNVRSGLAVLLNYQFDTQNSYIQNGQADYQSCYFYFQYKNFPTLIKQINEINEIVLDDSTKRAVYSQQKVTNIFITITIILIILQSGFEQQIQKFQTLLKSQDPNYLYQESIRLQQLYILIENNCNFISNYKLNIKEKDAYFKGIAQNLRNIKQTRRQKKFLNYKFNLLHLLIKIIQLLFSFSIFLIYQQQIDNCYQRFQLTCNFYQALIDLNINTLVLYQTREVLYYRSIFQFLDEKDFGEYYQISKNSLQGLENYISKLWILSDNKYFVDQSFTNLLIEFSQGNICDQLNIINEIKFSKCSSTLSGLLQKGFSPTIINLKNQITTELIQTNFTNRINYPILELEGVYFLCSSFQHLLKNFFTYFTIYNEKIEIEYSLIITVCLILSLLYAIFLLKYLDVFEWGYFKLLMKFLCIVPQSAIILDDCFQRNTRVFLKNDNLI